MKPETKALYYILRFLVLFGIGLSLAILTVSMIGIEWTLIIALTYVFGSLVHLMYKIKVEEFKREPK
jgi:hypothetical protein